MGNGSPIGKASADTMALVTLFAAGDGFIPHGHIRLTLGLTEDAGIPYNRVQSALRMVMRDHGHVYDVVPGKGYKLLTDEEIVQSGDRFLSVIRNRSRKLRTRFSKIKDYEKLSTERKYEALAKASVAAAIEHATKGSSQKRLRKQIANTSAVGELPVARTLEVLRGGK